MTAPPGRPALKRWTRLIIRTWALTTFLACLGFLNFGYPASLAVWSRIVGSWGVAQDYQCVGWRATHDCHPYGHRDPPGDKSCDSVITGSSGFCECAGRIAAARVPCGRHKFTCRDVCQDLLLPAGGPRSDGGPSVGAAGGARGAGPAGWQLQQPAPPSSAPGAWAPWALLPEPISCGANETEQLLDSLAGLQAAARSSAAGGSPAQDGSPAAAVPRLSSPATPDPAELDRLSAQARHLWDEIDSAIGHFNDVDGTANELPGCRDRWNRDWVKEGYRLPPSALNHLRVQTQAANRSMPAYPGASHFRGRGIVMVGGGLPYIASAWTGLAMLRASGCNLHAELWFPVSEVPTRALEAYLARRLGVTCRRLDLRDMAQHGFVIKIAALLLSRFQEVLFLDADNIAVANPAYLFNTREYQATGALLWPDYWTTTAARGELAEALQLPPGALPNGSHESGQIVVDKSRHWRGLLMAAYFNYYQRTWADLFTSFMGKGDKETFAYGLLAAGERFHVIGTPTGSAGLRRPMDCRRRSLGRAGAWATPPSSYHSHGASSRGGGGGYSHHHRSSAAVLPAAGDAYYECADRFAGNTMVQHDPQGRVLFLHANMRKLNTAIPDRFEDYTRRWQWLRQLELAQRPPSSTVAAPAAAASAAAAQSSYLPVVGLPASAAAAAAGATAAGADEERRQGVAEAATVALPSSSPTASPSAGAYASESESLTSSTQRGAEGVSIAQATIRHSRRAAAMREEDNTAGLASPVAFEPHPQGSRGSSSAAGRGSSGDGLDGNGADAVPAMGTTLAAALAGQPLRLVETDFLAWSLHHLGVDIELLVYRALRAFRCAPFYQHSTRMRIRLGDPPPPQLDRSGLHPANPGFEFSKVHQQGIPGVGLAELASPVSLSDRLQHWFHKRWYHWARGAWRRAFDRSRRRSNAELHQCTDQLHQKKG